MPLLLVPALVTDSPLFAEYRNSRATHRDTAERWAEAINAYFDGEENPRNDDDVFTVVCDILGTPSHSGDVEHWHARTAAWRNHALAALATVTDVTSTSDASEGSARSPR